MKSILPIRILFCLLTTTFLVQSCNVGYQYDIESGTDDYKGEGKNVTVDTSKSIDVTMYDRARIFPGLVDTAKQWRVIDTAISVNLALNYANPSVMAVTATPQPFYSTGLYAGAGELVTIYVDGNVNGLAVQIGSHMDDLTNEGTLSREPLVFTKKALFPGKNYVRNNLGGYIWVVKQGSFVGDSNYKLRFENVYKAPDYVRGAGIDPTRWANEIRSTTVPWLELRGKHVAFSVSRARMESKLLEDPGFVGNLETLMQTWDNIIENYCYQYYGMTAGNSEPRFRAPEFPERLILDVQLKSNSYMRWTGQPLVALNTNMMINDITDLQSLIAGKSINVFTALMNNYMLIRSPFWAQVQTASQSLPLYRLTENSFKANLIPKMSDIFQGEGLGINTNFPLALSYAKADSSKWLKIDKGTNLDAYALLPLVQLANYNNNDWVFYTSLNKKIKNNELYNGLGSFFGALCSYFRKDFSPFFDHWGIDLSDGARQQGAAYPLLDQTMWQYNPLSKSPSAEVGFFDVSKYKYRSNRSTWNIAAFDKDYYNNDQPGDDNQQVQNVLDGNKDTYWHTQWRGAVLPLPHYLVIDMKNKQQVDGFYLAFGSREYRGTKLVVQTTDRTNFNLDDMSIQWYNIAELRPVEDIGNYSTADGVKPYPGLSEKYTNEQFFEFLTPKNIRYMRIILPSQTGKEKNSTHHTLAEFGTYYYK